MNMLAAIKVHTVAQYCNKTWGTIYRNRDLRIKYARDSQVFWSKDYSYLSLYFMIIVIAMITWTSVFNALISTHDFTVKFWILEPSMGHFILHVVVAKNGLLTASWVPHKVQQALFKVGPLYTGLCNTATVNFQSFSIKLGVVKVQRVCSTVLFPRETNLAHSFCIYLFTIAHVHIHNRHGQRINITCN